jgi:hypothetical protein
MKTYSPFLKGRKIELDNRISTAEDVLMTIRLDKNNSAAQKKKKESALELAHNKIKALEEAKIKLKQKLARLEAISKKKRSLIFYGTFSFAIFLEKRKTAKLGLTL